MSKNLLFVIKNMFIFVCDSTVGLTPLLMESFLRLQHLVKFVVLLFSGQKQTKNTQNFCCTVTYWRY